MCEGCGHTWTARNTDGKARQCSKCRSRRLVEVSNDVVSGGESAETVDGDVTVKARPSAVSIMEDPEVREKLKELEIAKLNKQLHEVKFGSVSNSTIERVVMRQNLLLEELIDSRIIDDEALRDIRSMCPWCGESGDGGLAYEEFRDGRMCRNGYRCASCQHWVPF